MIELLIFGAGAAVGALTLALPYHRAASDRDVLQATKDSLAVDVELLGNRVTTLRGDNIALQHQVDTLRTGHDKLVDERDQLKRELGRIEAERRAAMLSPPVKPEPGTIALTPTRDAKGKFLPKPKPPKSMPKPVACG